MTVAQQVLVAGVGMIRTSKMGKLDVLTVSASAHFHNLQLQKSPSRVFGQNSGNSADISKAFFEMGIWKFESSQVSQAVTQSEIVDPIIR